MTAPNIVYLMFDQAKAAAWRRIPGTAETPGDFQQECLSLRSELGIIAGDRGFVEGWE